MLLLRWPGGPPSDCTESQEATGQEGGNRQGSGSSNSQHFQDAG